MTWQKIFCIESYILKQTLDQMKSPTGPIWPDVCTKTKVLEFDSLSLEFDSLLFLCSSGHYKWS